MKICRGITCTFSAIGYVSSTGAMMYVWSGAMVSIEDQKRFETFGLVEDFISTAIVLLPFVRIRSTSAPFEVL